MTKPIRRFGAFALLVVSPGVSAAQDPVASPIRQALDDAWWTGPMIANSAATLPRGHALVETYVYDVRSGSGDSFGTLSYLLYGLTDRLTVGLQPNWGFNAPQGARASSGVGFGDLTLQAQYRLTRFDAARGVPALAVSLQETLPTGRYDRLGARPADGFGGGAHGTTIGLNVQHYWWLPNGRILRGRVNVSHTVAGRARLRDVSVYGTSEGFRGHAWPGGNSYLGGSLEYSVTRRFVVALDAAWTHRRSTRVAGRGAADPATGMAPAVRSSSPATDVLAVAPGVEYSWRPDRGVLLAARFVPARANVPASVTPAIAINAVF